MLELSVRDLLFGWLCDRMKVMVITERDILGRIIKSKGRTPIDINLEKAIELYKGSLSIREVAKAIGTNAGVLQRHFKNLGISKDKGWRSRGVRWSEATKRKASEARKRLLADPIMKERYCMGANNPFYGKKHKPETIEAMKKKLSIILSGEGNPQWQGGKSLEAYSSEFKRNIRHQVYSRDNYQCQNCRIIHQPSSGRLIAHHKDANKENCETDNLITLCRPCHGRITMGARWGKGVVSTL